jgi:hypothetical protein
MGQQAWFNGDWLRTAVAGVMLLCAVAALVSAILKLLSWKVLLGIDAEGLRTHRLPDGYLAWARMASIAVVGPIGDRHVAVTGLGPEARVWWLDLRSVGVAPRWLLGEIARLAPAAPVVVSASPFGPSASRPTAR